MLFFQTVDALLKETLPVIPDSVLDSLPPLETHTSSLFSDLAPLPLAPLSAQAPSHSVNFGSNEFLDERMLVAEHM